MLLAQNRRIGSPQRGSLRESNETTGAKGTVRNSTEPKVRRVRIKFIKTGSSERAARLRYDRPEAKSSIGGPIPRRRRRTAAGERRLPRIFHPADRPVGRWQGDGLAHQL